MVIFEANGQEYCSDLENVRKIIKASNYDCSSYNDIYIIRMSGMEFKPFEGVIVNNPADLANSSKMLILSIMNSIQLGVIADRIVEFLSMEQLFMKNLIHVESDQGLPLIKWKLFYQNRVIYYPDYDKIISKLETINYNSSENKRIII